MDWWTLVFDMEWLTLIFAALAAAAALPVAWWGWIDRPQTGWWLRRSREEFRPSTGPEGLVRIDLEGRHRASIFVHAIGTAPVYEVEVRISGATLWGPAELTRSSPMTHESCPIEFDVMIPPAGEGDPWVEVWWLQLRPRLQLGERWNLRTIERQRWRWRLTSLRICPPAGAPWWKVWKVHPVRKSGCWQPGYGWPQRIPKSSEPC